jgi:cysteine-rich repeat protein
MPTMRTLRPVALSALAAVLVALPPSAARATQPADLCTGNPCIVSGAQVVDAGSVLDFGAVDLQLTAQATLTVGPGGFPPAVTLRAADILLEPGARILGGGADAEVTLEAETGDIRIQRTGGSFALIDLSANEGGTASLTAAGRVTVHGTIDVQGKNRDAQAGSILIEAGGAVNVSGSLLASASGSGSAGGGISITAGDGISTSGTLNTSGGDFGGGDIELVADGGDIQTTGSFDTSGGSPEGYAGLINASAPLGSVDLGATVAARGATGSAEACGDGGGVEVEAGGDVVFSGPMDLTGGRHCLGGSVTVTNQGDFIQLAAGSITATAAGVFGAGGEIEIASGGNASLRRIDLTSPGAGGIVSVTASLQIAIDDRVDASGTGSQGFPGTIDLSACEIVVSSSGRLVALGLADPTSGVNTLRASGGMTIAGTLDAKTRNELRYRTTPPIVTGAVNPAPTIVADPTLPPCPPVPVCGDGISEGNEICDDGNVASCDGCSADCSHVDDVCGDGLAECGEECDDGNVVDGDGCEATCALTPLVGARRPGKPRASAGCLTEWSFGPWAKMEPETGFAAVRQVCTDGDPACDHDGAADGVCTYEVQACLRSPEPGLPVCTPEAVDFVKLRTPRTSDSDEIDAANAAALRAAFAALGVTVREGARVVENGSPVAGMDSCTAPIALRVPTSGETAGTRKLSVGARDVSGLVMTTNPLRLRCKPRVEACGDGIVQEGEECDPSAPGSPAGRCDASCSLVPGALRIPGGSGTRRKDCPFEWSIDLNPADVRADRRDVPTYVQSCRDGDPTCDFDPTPGNCRLRLWGCAGGEDARLGCVASIVRSVSLLAPREDAPYAFERQARDALAGAIAGLGFPTGPGEVCTRKFEVDVPVGPSRLALRVDTHFGSGNQTESDALVLRCRR